MTKTSLQKEKIFVKVFKLSNKETGELTKEDFYNFTNKFEVIRKLYFRIGPNVDCYDNFRTITKEVKRAAHNANLDCKLLKVKYDSDHLNVNILSDEDDIHDINLIIFINFVKEIKKDCFSILQVKGINKLKFDGDANTIQVNWYLDKNSTALLVPKYVYIQPKMNQIINIS